MYNVFCINYRQLAWNVFCVNGRRLDGSISVSRRLEDPTSALRDLRPAMSKDTTLYRIDVGDHRLVASSSIGGLQGLLIGEVPGRYVIEEVTSPPGFLSTPKSRRWGWAIKHDDGRVELEPEIVGG